MRIGEEAMSRTLSRRVAAIESQQGEELPPDIREWLGWPITDEERASIKPRQPMTDEEIKEFDEWWRNA